MEVRWEKEEGIAEEVTEGEIVLDEDVSTETDSTHCRSLTSRPQVLVGDENWDSQLDGSRRENFGDIPP